MANRITTAELDTFARSDEDPLSKGGQWGVVDPVDYPTQLVLINAVARGKNVAGPTVWTSRWLPLTVSGDVQVWGVAEEPPTLNQFTSLRLLGNTGLGTSTLYGYIVNFRNQGLNTAESKLYRMDNSVATVIDTQTAANFFTSGNLLLLETLANDVRVSISRDAGVNWDTVNQVTDSTYRSNFKLVLCVIETFSAFGDWQGFGGGPSASLTTRNQLPYLGVGP